MIGWETTYKAPCFFRLKMQPVTLGHLFLLSDYGLDVEAGLDREGIMLAAFVCAQSHTESRRDLKRRLAPWLFKLWGWRCGEKAFADVEPFIDWFHQQLRGPITVSSPDSRRRESGAPLHFNLLACCMGMLGMSEKDALDTTVLRARQLVCALGEARGELSLWTRGDERRRELSVELGLMEPRRN